MLSYRMKCKRCGGFLYEEETFYDQNDVCNMQIGCYICSHKAYIPVREWDKFKAKLAEACKRAA